VSYGAPAPEEVEDQQGTTVLVTLKANKPSGHTTMRMRAMVASMEANTFLQPTAMPPSVP
jgi:hypothetical protein